jgi:glycosyltransferase involved in cell wall biosynthesis
VRVVLYTRPSLFETGVSLAAALGRRAEVHLLLEVAPESWRTSAFDVPLQALPAGIVDGRVLDGCVPPAVWAYWSDLASFRLVVHTAPRSLHPATWRVSRQALRYVRGLRPDVVHFDDASLRLGWAARGLRSTVPVIFSVHDPEPHSGEQEWRTSLAYWLSFHAAARYIVHNRAQLARFRARFRLPPHVVDVVHLGAYDIARAWQAERAAPATADRPMVLFFGRLSPYKGLEVLLQAAPHVAERVAGVRFVVAGRPIPGYQVPPLPDLPNGGRIDLLEQYIPSAEVGALFASASVVACPYVDATQSGVVLTAYAFERPVVATTVGGLPEYVRHDETGLLVPPGDPMALAEALVRLLQDEGLQARLSQGVRMATAGAFNWNRAAAETLEVYSRARPGPILRPPHGATG